MVLYCLIVFVLCAVLSHGYTIFDDLERLNIPLVIRTTDNTDNTDIKSTSVKTSSSVPMISVSLNVDSNNYLARLLESIDYPVDMICIQIGNSDINTVNSIIESIQVVRLKRTELNIQVSTLAINPGSARGFNFGLHNMMNSPKNIPYVLVVNSDIAFYPGILKSIHEQASKALENPDFGIGFTSLCCGGEWSAVVFTHRLVERIGYFDENFYPAYYEDDDYAIRTHLSSLKALKFPNTPLLHGNIDGSKDYLSGLFVKLYLAKSLTPELKAWRKAQELGQIASKAYLEAKWNIKMPDITAKVKPVGCKTIEGINDLCRVGYTHPFGETSKPLSAWTINMDTQKLIAIANPI